MIKGSGKATLSVLGVNSLAYAKLCTELNKPVYGKDYKALSGHMEYTAGFMKTFELEKDPADALLTHWATKCGNNVKKLIGMLKKMERDDLVEMLESQGNFYFFHFYQQVRGSCVLRHINNGMNMTSWASE